MFDFDKFYLQLLNGEVYFDDFPKGQMMRYKNKTLPLLVQNINNKDVEGLSATLSVLFYDGADSDYTASLLSLLDDNWHELEEDIVEVLGVIKDPSSIDKLYEVAINIPDYDEMRALAKKCIWALSEINTTESIAKLELLKEFKDPIIKENAILRLKNIG